MLSSTGLKPGTYFSTDFSKMSFDVCMVLSSGKHLRA